MTDMPLISIITPTYNHENYIAACIDSVLAQTFPDWEMIIVDDASSDRTPAIVREYGKKDGRIRFCPHPSNWGKNHLADIYNEALGVARGKYVAVLEGDDYWPRGKLAIQSAALDAHPFAVLCHGLAALVGDRGTVRIPRYPWPASVRENQPRGSAFQALLLGDNPFHSQTVMIRKKSLERVGGFKPDSFPSLATDYPTWLELAFQGPFVFLPRILGYWRRYPTSVSFHHQAELWTQHIEYTRLFLASHRSEWQSLGLPIRRCARYASCWALLDLGKLKVMARDFTGAGDILGRLHPCRRLIFRNPSKALKFLTLRVCISARKDIYKGLLRFSKKYKWYRGIS